MHFCEVQFYNAFTMNFTVYRYWNKFLKLEKLVRMNIIYVWNCAHAFTCAYEWENLIVADVKISKWNFNFYCHPLHKISVINSKFRNDIANILCSVLNSRLLKPTIWKLSLMFIEFRYILSIRVKNTLFHLDVGLLLNIKALTKIDEWNLN